MSKFEKLKELGEIVDIIKRTPTPESYWKKEEEILEKIMNKNAELYLSLRMSYEKLNTYSLVEPPHSALAC